jgi:dTDP-4-dehydrorhamnose 3,5-epimerase
MRETGLAVGTPTAAEALASHLQLPTGVKLHRLESHRDSRGSLTEIFRDSWGLGQAPVQWNMVRSARNVLRGVHLHRRHADYLLMADGEMVLILHDVRAESPLRGVTVLLRLQSADPHMAVIPVGVAHGFYFPAPALHVYGLTHGFDGSDELGCDWRAAELGIRSLCTDPELSRRDAGAGSYAQMIDDYHA